MSPPPFGLVLTDEGQAILDQMASEPHSAAKLKKVNKTLALLEVRGPSHPGLQSHKYQSLQGPAKEDVWESYVENKTPSAWRIFWCFGPERGQITILTIGPHP